MERILTLYTRYLWKEKNIIWVRAKTPKLYQSMEQYHQMNGIALPVAKNQLNAMKELIVATTLAAESQMERDSWGWTMRMPYQNWGIFCAVDPEGMVCTRIRQLPKEAAEVVGMIVVQRQMPELPVRQTNLIPFSEEIHCCVEQFFDESEQLPARIAIQGDEAAMALSMPDAAWDEVAALSEHELISLFDKLLAEDKLEKTHEAVYFYDCRCNEDAMHRMLDALPETQRREIWGNEASLEIECPRCGKKYRIERKG